MRGEAAAFPQVLDDSGYLTYRCYQIYRAALEGSVHDAVLDPTEASALRRLRDGLGLITDDHRLLESDVRRAVPAMAA